MRVSITGVDGTGKTSIIRALARQVSGPKIHAFRAPQYHEDPDAPFARLSALIDQLSVHADRVSDPLLKTSALFMSMTLYGDVESHYMRAFRPQILFSERQALADSLAYSKFYRSLLTGPVQEVEIPGLELLDEWVEVLKRRVPAHSPLDMKGLCFRNLPLLMKDLFSLSPSELVDHLRAFYQCELPEQIILLKVSMPTLMERLALKERDGQQKELHEKAPVLEALQGALEHCCQTLVSMNPSTRLHILDTSELNLGQSRDRCLELVT